MLHRKFKPQHNRFVILLQYHKLHRKDNKCVQEWMGRLRTRAAECQYKEYNRLVTEQFINGLNDNGMLNKILKEVATQEDIDDTTSECILLLLHIVEA